MQGYMPVFVNTTVPTEGPVAMAPDAELMQPAPVDPNVQKIKDAKANVEKYKRRVKCTSWIFILIGIIGMCASVYFQMTAKHHAMMMANFPPPPHHGRHGGKHHHPPPPPRLEDAPKFVSRDEFNLYDAIKTLTAITFFLSAKILALGKCGKRMTWRNKSWATKWIAKKSCCLFAFIVLVGIFAAKEGHHIHHIKKRILMSHQGEEGWPSIDEMGGRHLQSQALEELESPMMFEDQTAISEPEDFMDEILTDDEDMCNALGSADDCEANVVCSWCTAGAVADACHSIENAKRLPAAVFQCSKLSRNDVEEEVNEVEIEEEEEEPVEVEEPVEEPEFLGRNHHGQRHHERRDEPSDDEMHIVAGLPVRADVYKKIAPYLHNQEGEHEMHGEFRGHHGKHHGRHGEHGRQGDHGRHGKHGKGPHHKKHCCIVTKILAVTLVASHFMFIKGLKHSQETLEKLTGVEKPNWGCGKWRKNKFGKCKRGFQQQQAQQVFVTQPVIAQNEIHEEQDKQEGIVFAPAQTIVVDKNQMI